MIWYISDWSIFIIFLPSRLFKKIYPEVTNEVFMRLMTFFTQHKQKPSYRIFYSMSKVF